MEEKKVKNIFLNGAISADFISDSIQKHALKKNIGAHSIFLGQVREDLINSQSVAAIEYTAYPEMALEKMDEIRRKIFSKYPLTCLHVHHSLGEVKAGEISLFVFASSKHRMAAIEACNETVEIIKKELPVWGKEIFENKTSHWKENK